MKEIIFGFAGAGFVLFVSVVLAWIGNFTVMLIGAAILCVVMISYAVVAGKMWD